MATEPAIRENSSCGTSGASSAIAFARAVSSRRRMASAAIRRPSSGSSSRIRSNSARPSTWSVASVRARTAAVRAPPATMASSPTREPGPRTAIDSSPPSPAPVSTSSSPCRTR